MSPANDRHGRVAAWAVLLGMGGTSFAYNVYHATHATGGRLIPLLAVLFGLSPVYAALGLSHIAASNRNTVRTVVTYLVMAGAMVLSAGATAKVVAPVAGGIWMGWLFSIVLDAASMISLNVLLMPDKAGPSGTGSGTGTSGDTGGNSGTGSSSIESGSCTGSSSGNGSGSNTGSDTGNGAQYRTTAPVAEKVPVPVASGTAKPKKPGSRKRQPDGSATDNHLDDLDTEARAFDLLRANPDMSGADLDRALGFSPNSGRGRQLRRKLTTKYPEDLVPGGSPSGDQETGQA